jgi:hypothetical protein
MDIINRLISTFDLLLGHSFFNQFYCNFHEAKSQRQQEQNEGYRPEYDFIDIQTCNSIGAQNEDLLY